MVPGNRIFCFIHYHIFTPKKKEMKKSASTFLHEHSPNKSAMYNETWIIEAMKSYTKQWIDSASIVGRMYGGINTQKAIENLKSQIDNQNEA